KATNVNLQKFQPSTAEKASMDELKNLEGARFDEAFLANLEWGHQRAAQQLRFARNEVQDPRIRDLIDSTLPKVEQHHQAVRRAEQQIGLAGEVGKKEPGQKQKRGDDY